MTTTNCNDNDHDNDDNTNSWYERYSSKFMGCIFKHIHTHHTKKKQTFLEQKPYLGPTAPAMNGCRVFSPAGPRRRSVGWQVEQPLTTRCGTKKTSGATRSRKTADSQWMILVLVKGAQTKAFGLYLVCISIYVANWVIIYYLITTLSVRPRIILWDNVWCQNTTTNSTIFVKERVKFKLVPFLGDEIQYKRSFFEWLSKWTMNIFCKDDE